MKTLNLRKSLRDARCAVPPRDFRMLVDGMLGDRFWGWTDEDLLHRPREAIRFCNLVREAAGAPDLEDQVILRTLTNVRKGRHREGRSA